MVPEVGGVVALTTGTEARERPTPTCSVCEKLVACLGFGGGRRGKYCCENLGGGDILISWETKPSVAGIGDYGDEARKAAEEAWSPGPGVHFH